MLMALNPFLLKIETLKKFEPPNCQLKFTQANALIIILEIKKITYNDFFCIFFLLLQI